MKSSNQDKVQHMITALKSKRRKDRSVQDKVRLLQLQLYAKAKQDASFCFYILYDKLFLSHILEEAYRRVRASNGSPGIDGQTFESIEAAGLSEFLGSLGESLRKRDYQPDAVKRIWIEKESGGKRPLGIPTIRDRVAQTACKIVLEPIFEADFIDSSYGFRPKRSASDAMKELKSHLHAGLNEVYDADLQSYFDTIPHDKLMTVLKTRVSDKRVLYLIKQWLKAPLVDETGRYHSGKQRKEGTPQGSVLSPLLANIYLNLFDKIVTRKGGYFDRKGIKIVRYADDFVLLGKKIDDDTLHYVDHLMSRMELSLNRQKTRVVNAVEESFTFLGFEISYSPDRYGRPQRYWDIHASPKSVKRCRQKLRQTLARIGHFPPEEVAKALNRQLRGWVNYFKIEGCTYHRSAARDITYYLKNRLRRYYNRKSQRKSRLHGTQAYAMLTEKHGLIDMAKV